MAHVNKQAPCSCFEGLLATLERDRHMQTLKASSTSGPPAYFGLLSGSSKTPPLHRTYLPFRPLKDRGARAFLTLFFSLSSRALRMSTAPLSSR